MPYQEKKYIAWGGNKGRRSGAKKKSAHELKMGGEKGGGLVGGMELRWQAILSGKRYP